MKKESLFLFDMNTEYKFREVLGQRAFGSAEEAAAYIWENDYDEEEKINEYYVSFFIEQENGLYERVEEYHYERAYTTEEVAQALQAAGWSCWRLRMAIALQSRMRKVSACCLRLD